MILFRIVVDSSQSEILECNSTLELALGFLDTIVLWYEESFLRAAVDLLSNDKHRRGTFLSEVRKLYKGEKPISCPSLEERRDEVLTAIEKAKAFPIPIPSNYLECRLFVVRYVIISGNTYRRERLIANPWIPSNVTIAGEEIEQRVQTWWDSASKFLEDHKNE